jgi:2-polyprenyl-6-hydroxyphenyl methylase/3-demethylubiquinone-9 3-methyltransferase
MSKRDDLIELCAPLGDNGRQYLRDHVERFRSTKARLLRSAALPPGARVLDVGAHWLHQSVLYAAHGCCVTALDVPETFSVVEVRDLARHHSIHLLSNSSLEHPSALAAIDQDSFDLVLFTEIIEHLTFNPVVLWREIYRVIKPGGRIIVTTPNYYGLRATLRRWLRAIRLDGSGVEVDRILSTPTFGHHWKEYSARELARYFAQLSPDFAVSRVVYTEEYHPQFRYRKLASWIERTVPPWRPDLYLEIALPRKRCGVVPQPRW